MLDHELAHIIAIEGKVDIPWSDLYSIQRNIEESDKLKEKATYKYFNEPVISGIIRWDCLSIQKGIEEIVAKDMQLVNQQSFDSCPPSLASLQK